VCSNFKMFKYCWVWAKSLKVGFQNANRRPLKNHEDIVVFGGGIIPEDDIAPLSEIGVAKIFTPGTTTTEIVEWVRATAGPAAAA